MCMEEFERADAEVESVVNPHAKPDAIEQAERLTREAKEQAQLDSRMQDKQKAWQAKRAAEQCRRILWLTLKVIACVVAALLFLMAMLDPAWVPMLSYTGLAACLIVGAIVIDRQFGRQ